MSDEVVISAEVAQQVAEILLQNEDPAVQELASIINPPPPPPVPSIFESVETIIGLGNPVSISSSDTAVAVLSYISSRVSEILGDSVPADFSAQITNIIKND